MTNQSIRPARVASVAVYLNDGRGSQLGFNPAEARLRLASRFTIPAPVSPQEVLTALKNIYVQLNVGGDVLAAHDYTVDYRTAGHRSLSVGDVVIIGENAFAVARFGFDTISAGAVSAALAAAAS